MGRAGLAWDCPPKLSSSGGSDRPGFAACEYGYVDNQRPNGPGGNRHPKSGRIGLPWWEDQSVIAGNGPGNVAGNIGPVVVVDEHGVELGVSREFPDVPDIPT